MRDLLSDKRFMRAMILFATFQILVLILVLTSHAEDYKKLDNGNWEVDGEVFKKDIKDLERLEQFEEMIKVKTLMASSIENLDKQIIKLKQNEELNAQIIQGLELMNGKYKEFSEYADKRILTLIKELESAESRGGGWIEKIKSQAAIPMFFYILLAIL